MTESKSNVLPGTSVSMKLLVASVKRICSKESLSNSFPNLDTMHHEFYQ